MRVTDRQTNEQTHSLIADVALRYVERTTISPWIVTLSWHPMAKANKAAAPAI